MATAATPMSPVFPGGGAALNAGVIAFRPMSLRAMPHGVLDSRQHLQIFRPIVGLVPIDVMDMLTPKQLSSQHSLSYDPMLIYRHSRISRGSYADVALGVKRPAFPAWVSWPNPFAPGLPEARDGAVAGCMTGRAIKALTTDTARSIWGVVGDATLLTHRKLTPFGAMPPAVPAARGLSYETILL